MAKRKSSKKNSMNLIKKGITLAAAVLTFVFLFLEVLAVKVKTVLFEGTALEKVDVGSEGVKFSDLLFNEDYSPFREELSLTTVVLWAVFILVIIALVVSVLSFVMNKQGTLLAKVGGGLLVAAMVVLFVVNFDKSAGGISGLATGETWVTNITALYFVSLVVSFVGLGSALTLKK